MKDTTLAILLLLTSITGYIGNNDADARRRENDTSILKDLLHKEELTNDNNLKEIK